MIEKLPQEYMVSQNGEMTRLRMSTIYELENKINEIIAFLEGMSSRIDDIEEVVNKLEKETLKFDPNTKGEGATIGLLV